MFIDMLEGYSVYGLTPGGWCLGPYLFDMKTKYTVFGRLFDFTKFVNEFTVHLLIVLKKGIQNYLLFISQSAHSDWVAIH